MLLTLKIKDVFENDVIFRTIIMTKEMLYASILH